MPWAWLIMMPFVAACGRITAGQSQGFEVDAPADAQASDAEMDAVADPDSAIESPTTDGDPVPIDSTLLSDGSWAEAGTGGPCVNMAPTPCTVDGWCWMNPLPDGLTMRAVWGSGSTEVWTVGDQGLIRHWDGKMWSVSSSGTSVRLNAVWGASATDVWAVGASGTIRRWDGTKWSSMSAPVSGDILTVTGLKATDVWLGGTFGFAHWDGAKWTTLESPTTWPITSISMLDGGSGWAGSAAHVLRWDGVKWAEVFTCCGGPIGQPIAGVWAAAKDDVWAVTSRGSYGYPGTIVHWDGKAWYDFGSLWGIDDFTGIWGRAKNDVYAMGPRALRHWDGVAWSAGPRTRGRGVWARAKKTCGPWVTSG